MSDPTEARREALRAFVAANGGHARVVAKFKLNASKASYLSQLITENSTASFGEKSAKNWEDRLSIRDGRISNSPQARPAPGIAPPPLPPRDFSDPPTASVESMQILEDLELVLTEDEIRSIRERAKRIRQLAQVQLERQSNASKTTKEKK